MTKQTADRPPYTNIETEYVAMRLANEAAANGYNWYWDDDTGAPVHVRWDELPAVDSEINGGWVLGRSFFRGQAATAIRAIEEHRGGLAVDEWDDGDG